MLHRPQLEQHATTISSSTAYMWACFMTSPARERTCPILTPSTQRPAPQQRPCVKIKPMEITECKHYSTILLGLGEIYFRSKGSQMMQNHLSFLLLLSLQLMVFGVYNVVV